jgi:hypothetical protein
MSSVFFENLKKIEPVSKTCIARLSRNQPGFGKGSCFSKFDVLGRTKAKFIP